MMRGPTINSGACVLVFYLVAFILCFAPEAFSSSTIPWSDSFDPYTADVAVPTTNGWGLSTNTIIAQTTNKFAGTKAVAIPASTVLTNLFTKDTVKTNVWIDMRVKVATSETPPTFPSSISGAFFFHTNGCPVVQTGTSTNWLTNTLTMASTAVPKNNVTAGNWVRVTIYKDYLRHKWALFVDGTLIRDDFSFYNASVNGLSGFSIENRSFLDEVWVSTNMPNAGSGSHTNLLGDIDNDLIPDAWEIDYFGSINLYNGGSDPDNDGLNNAEEWNGGVSSTDPTVANHGAQGMPYREDFDTAASGAVTSAWHGMIISGIANVISSDSVDSGKSLSISNGSLQVLIDDADSTNVWVQFYSKISPYDDGSGSPTPTTNDQAVFYVNTNLDLMAYSGSSWLKVRTNSIPTNVWVGFATHLDYSGSGTWDLFVSTNGGYNVQMERVNGAPMDFNSGNTATSGKLTNMEFSVGVDMLIDAIAVSPAYSNTATVHSYVRGYDRLVVPVSTEIPPYNYAGTNSTLVAGGDLGEDVKRGLSDGDSLQAFYTPSNTWSLYNLEVGEWAKQNGLNVEDLLFTPSISVKIKSSEDMTVFYTYSSLPTNSPSETFVGTVNGTGWNEVLVDFDIKRTLNNPPATGFNFANAAAGDRVYINGNRYIYNGDLGKWKARTGGVVTNESIGPGSGGFWYYRKDASDMTWTLP